MYLVICIYHMPGGLVVGNSGLCCCGPAFEMCDTSIVRAQLLPIGIVCVFYRTALASLGLILFEITIVIV